MSTAYDDRVLSVQRVKIDTISSISVTLPQPSNPCDQTLIGLHYHRTKMWAENVFTTWKASELREALGRTLTGDVIGNPVAPQFAHRTSPEELEFPYLLDCDHDSHSHTDERNLLLGWHALMYKINVDDTIRSRKLCHTAQNRMALISAKAVHGDEIWIFKGIPIPYVLRRLDTCHVLVGPCYIHELMDGEALSLAHVESGDCTYQMTNDSTRTYGVQSLA